MYHMGKFTKVQLNPRNLLEALTELRRRRDIRPNDDFLAQVSHSTKGFLCYDPKKIFLSWLTWTTSYVEVALRAASTGSLASS